MLMLKGIITFKYWFEYKYHIVYIIISRQDVEFPTEMLWFGVDFKLVGEDVYRIVNSDESDILNKEITNPIDGATYTFDRDSNKFELVFDPR